MLDSVNAVISKYLSDRKLLQDGFYGKCFVWEDKVISICDVYSCFNTLNCKKVDIKGTKFPLDALIFIMHVEGYSGEKIALDINKHFGLNLYQRKVNRILHRARKHLQGIMKEREII